MLNDEKWMRLALEAAAEASAEGEVPVGAVAVLNGELVAHAWNRPIAAHDPSAHAEILALRQAASSMNNYRLPGLTLYVTLEPCPMCVGAMIHARVARLVFGASDPKTGAVHSAWHLAEDARHNHKMAVTGGVLAEDCGQMLRQFFRSKRASNGNSQFTMRWKISAEGK
jgi:tRNA(adenine34) deaminase